MAEKKKKQFDEFLGGSESLPHEVSFMQFVSSRAREISAMTTSIGTYTHTYFKVKKLLSLKYKFSFFRDVPSTKNRE